jgi:hypothetical protein
MLLNVRRHKVYLDILWTITFTKIRNLFHTYTKKYVDIFFHVITEY